MQWCEFEEAIFLVNIKWMVALYRDYILILELKKELEHGYDKDLEHTYIVHQMPFSLPDLLERAQTKPSGQLMLNHPYQIWLDLASKQELHLRSQSR